MNNTEIIIVEAITVKYYSKGAFLNRFDLAVQGGREGHTVVAYSVDAG